MKRLAPDNKNLNVGEYANVFKDRLNEAVDEFDVERWQLLVSKFRGGRLVDLGCLDSLVPLMAKKMYPEADVWALDNVPEVISFMSRANPTVEYTLGDVYQTKFLPGSFDYVVAGEVIEHLEEPEDFLVEAFRILKPGGVLALSTPLDEAREPGAVDRDHHLWSFSKQDIINMLQFHSSRVKTKVLRSTWFPYRYRFPTIVAWSTKR